MSPLLDMQRRAVEVGRLRIGAKVSMGNGKSRPSKLTEFRFTSRDENAIRAVAKRYGGEAKHWDGAPTDDQWEVFTEAREIDVTVPPGSQVLSQWYELWSGGGCQRRCDSVHDQIADKPCVCPSDPADRAELAKNGRACKPMTRLSVALPDIPGLGVWRLNSSGDIAAHELSITAELLAAVTEARVYVPAVLRLEQRTSNTGGKKDFVVPVLGFPHTMRQLQALPAGTMLLPPAPESALAIEAAPPRRELTSTATVETTAHVEAAQDVPPGDPQAMAVAVEACTDRQYLADKLARYARGKQWMSAFVESKYAPVEGELIELVEVFRDRDAELEGDDE